MASASVLLGLTPGLLASLGPSVAETALLSTQKPVLSILISMACPAIFPSRVLEYTDARELLHLEPFPLLSQIHVRYRILGVGWQLVQYVALSTAIFNVIYTSWQLGTRTVVSFQCTNYYLPLVWTCLSIGIHITASAAFWRLNRFALWRKLRQSQRNYQVLPEGWPASPNDGSLGSNTKNDKDLEHHVRPTPQSMIFHHLAACLGFVHLTFGICVFSSILFIDTTDAVVVILRYIVSTLTARSILIFELDHLRREVSRKKAPAQATDLKLQRMDTPTKLDKAPAWAWHREDIDSRPYI